MTDIDGALPRKHAGHTGSGVAIDRSKAWPYAVADPPDGMTELRDVAVEQHLTRGCQVVVRRRALEPLIQAPPPAIWPLKVIHRGGEFEEPLLQQLQRPRRPPPPVEREVRQRAPPASHEVPEAPRTLDKSLSTSDIAGARPRKLTSVHARHSGIRAVGPVQTQHVEEQYWPFSENRPGRKHL